VTPHQDHAGGRPGGRGGGGSGGRGSGSGGSGTGGPGKGGPGLESGGSPVIGRVRLDRFDTSSRRAAREFHAVAAKAATRPSSPPPGASGDRACPCAPLVHRDVPGFSDCKAWTCPERRVAGSCQRRATRLRRGELLTKRVGTAALELDARQSTRSRPAFSAFFRLEWDPTGVRRSYDGLNGPRRCDGGS
jgi:hypothetical protein